MSIKIDTTTWKKDLEEIISRLDNRDKSRENLLRLTRELTRKCREAVFHIHSKNFQKAEEALAQAKELVDKINEYKNTEPILYYSGSVNNAFTEYVEALTLYNIVKNERLISLSELEVTIPAYLAGFGDVIGELRRYALTLIKENKIDTAWEILRLMETLYVELIRLSYPEALLPGLRHKMDVARVIIENTRKDILFYEKSSELIQALEKANRFVSEKGEA